MTLNQRLQVRSRVMTEIICNKFLSIHLLWLHWVSCSSSTDERRNTACCFSLLLFLSRFFLFSLPPHFTAFSGDHFFSFLRLSLSPFSHFLCHLLVFHLSLLNWSCLSLLPSQWDLYVKETCGERQVSALLAMKGTAGYCFTHSSGEMAMTIGLAREEATRDIERERETESSSPRSALSAGEAVALHLIPSPARGEMRVDEMSEQLHRGRKHTCQVPVIGVCALCCVWRECLQVC